MDSKDRTGNTDSTHNSTTDRLAADTVRGGYGSRLPAVFSVVLLLAVAVTVAVAVLLLRHRTEAEQRPVAAVSVVPITIVDSRGKSITVQHSPQRIVSLLPSITESLCALSERECARRLVAVDRYSDWPPRLVQSLPTVGGGLDPSIEAIVSMRPDVVLVSNASRSVDRLESLGLTVIALEAQTFAQSRQVLDTLEKLLALPAGAADSTWQATQQRIAETAAALPDTAKGLRVYYEVSTSPHAAGESSFIGELLQRLGAVNIVPPALGPFPQLNPEYIVEKNPEVIFVAQENAGALSARPGWQGIRAVQTGHVCAITPAQRVQMIHPSPRMADGVKIMADCLAGRLSVPDASGTGQLPPAASPAG